jgi:hypothetical protein
LRRCTLPFGHIGLGPEYHRAFHDITTGNDIVVFPPTTIGGYPAKRG